MMNKPSANEISEGRDLNRYEVVVAVAKGARLATKEYLEVRERAEQLINNHDTDKSLLSLLGPAFKDQKPVRAAIDRIMDGEYEIHRYTDEEMAARDAAAEAEKTEETASAEA